MHALPDLPALPLRLLRRPQRPALRPPVQPAQRRAAAVLLLAGVLALHLAVLQEAARQPGGSHHPARQRLAAVWLVPPQQAPAPVAGGMAAAPAAGATPEPAPAAPPTPATGNRTASGAARTMPATPALARSAAQAAVEPAAPGAPEAAPAATGSSAGSTPQAAAAVPADGSRADAAPALAPDGSPVPVYATRPPPTTTLAYTLQRGRSTVQAELRWAQDGAGYTLALVTDDDTSAAGPLRGLGATSRGSFDAAGLAPERFVDRRRGRDRRAATFERSSGQLLQSASASAVPLQPGMQDRISWMLQLAAILQANPALHAPGARVQLWVAATRGPPQLCDFEVLPPDAAQEAWAAGHGEAHPTADAAAGSSAAGMDPPGGAAERPPGPGPATARSGPLPAGLLHLRRQATRPHELQVDAWLDPARHHLPWRVLLSAPPGDWRSDLQRAEP